MPKISEITYNSDMSTFINYEMISTDVEQINSNLKDINTNVLEILDSEINTGGLDLYAANINGVPIFHSKAVEIEQKVQTIYNECKEATKQIEKKAKEHRINELSKYIEELEKRIKELRAENERLEIESKDALSAYSQDVQENPAIANVPTASSNYVRYSTLRSQINKNNKELDGGWFDGGLLEKLKKAETELAKLN